VRSGGFANRAFWVLASVALALLVLFLVVFVSWINDLHELKAAEADARARLAELKSSVTGVDTAELEAQNEELETILSVLERELPQKAYVPTLLKQIEIQALVTGNTHAEARPGEWKKGRVITRTGARAAALASTDADAPAPVGQRYDELDLVLRFQGSYQSGFDLLKEMASLRKMLFVKEISIRRQGNAIRPDGGAQAEIDFEVTAFILEPAGGFPGDVVAEVHD